MSQTNIEIAQAAHMLPIDQVVASKPAWAEGLAMKSGEEARAILAAIFSGEQEEIRLRARRVALATDDQPDHHDTQRDEQTSHRSLLRAADTGRSCRRK
jgi:hypothetical protein